MTTLKCAIIDDEPIAIKGISEYISDLDFLSLEAVYESPVIAATELKKLQVDLIFLDIEMPKLNGLDLLKLLPRPPLVIITTAYPQYALQGYELDVVDYLLKPIPFERFMKACNKAREVFEMRESYKTREAQVMDYIYVKCDNKYEKILYADILFVEAMENFIAIQTPEKRYVTWMTLKAVEGYLPQDLFMRTHRSFIVSLAGIRQVDGNMMAVGEFSVPISKTLRETVMQRVLGGNLLKRN